MEFPHQEVEPQEKVSKEDQTIIDQTLIAAKERKRMEFLNRGRFNNQN